MIDFSPATRFPKPKILLVDLTEAADSRLSTAGFNVQSGTFGRPYKVQQSDKYVPVIEQPHLPNHTEQEVVIIDLKSLEPLSEQKAPTDIPEGVHGWFAKANRGIIDPRPTVMGRICDDWNRILSSGGVFVIFAEPRHQQTLVLATVRRGRIDDEREIPFDNWSFLSMLSTDYFKFDAEVGTESKLAELADFLDGFLRKHQGQLKFDTVIAPTQNLTYQGSKYGFVPFWNSKFGDHIGGIVYAKPPMNGRILILPQVNDKEGAVYELMTTVLPELCPHLFPFFEGGRWVHGDDYEHASIMAKKAEQQRFRVEADLKITELEGEIEAERKRNAFIHGILVGTGDELVADVKAILQLIGFQQVIEPDEESGSNKQEDLQIHDRSPALLVEIKGLAGQPTESDTHQVTKYVLRRMKEWSKTDVCGVFLVNHQRNIPALDRSHENVFTTPQVTDAIENDTGLLTTWDLFRLVRGMIEWKWPTKVVQDVFYGNGRLTNLPSHYELAGMIAHFYDQILVLSIDVGATGLRVGDTVGFLLPTGFFEETIASLQVEKKSVNEALSGQRAGYKTGLKRADIPVGTPIYVVRSTA
jgi:hypothetical protein